MPIYKIADLQIKINPFYKRTQKRLLPYVCDAGDFDFEIDVTDTDISQYLSQCKEPCSSAGAEGVLILTQLCNIILSSFDGFFFHSSSLMIDGEAYVFTALSGTGKSTHTALWREYFGDKVTMINDDKPIIRKHNGEFYIYGTPWMGKSEIGTNTKAPVKAVYILQRGTENKVERVKTGEVFKQILEATLVPADRENMTKLLALLDEFFSSVKLFKLCCNTNIDAAKTAYDAANTL